MRLGILYEVVETLDLEYQDKRLIEWMAKHSLGELEAILPYCDGKDREILESIVDCLRFIAEELYYWRSEVREYSEATSASSG